MNRTASKPQFKNKAPRIVAKLDLSDDMQRQLHAFFRRMHTGRWPKLRALALRQMPDGTIVEAAEWLRQAGDRFAIIEWAVEGPRLSWSCKPMPSRASAIAHLLAR